MTLRSYRRRVPKAIYCLATTPSKALGAIILQLHALFYRGRVELPKEMRQRVNR